MRLIGAQHPAARLATRLLFFVAGFGYGCWAPLVPLTKQRLAIDEHTLGLLILCIGIGSIAAMLASGVASVRYGSRPILIASGCGFAAALAVLPLAASPMLLALALLVFGATLGALDITMNLHALEVEQAAARPMMSGFHALFSIGGFAGAACMTLLLTLQWTPLLATLACSALMLLAMLVAAPRLTLAQPTAADSTARLVLPRGIVLLMALLAAIGFLVEGAVLDWSALLMTENALLPVAQSGLGFMVFSIAMTVGRLSGDAVASRLGDYRTLCWGGLLGLAGFLALLTANVALPALAGFVLIGLGCANVVPVLFRRAATQQVMPAGLALAAISTAGYAGILAGPAAIGFLAQASSLHSAFWVLAGLLAMVPLLARRVTARRTA